MNYTKINFPQTQYDVKTWEQLSKDEQDRFMKSYKISSRKDASKWYELNKLNNLIN